MPFEAMILKLRVHTSLSEEDIELIEKLPMHRKHVSRGTVMVSEGDRPDVCCLLIDGFASRKKGTVEGKSQILSIHIPGEIPDLQSLHLPVMDHSLVAQSDCVAGYIPHEAVRTLTRTRPLVAEALWRETLVDASIFREWILNVARRPAVQRLAHLICEMRHRLAGIKKASGGNFDFPLTQGDLAEAIGMTSVHVNRALQELRARKLLDIGHGKVNIADVAALETVAGFDRTYLHAYPASVSACDISST